MLRWSLLLFIVALIVGYFGLGWSAGILNDVAYVLFVVALIAFLVLDIATARTGGVEAIRHTWSKPARTFGARRAPLREAALQRESALQRQSVLQRESALQRH